MANNGRDRRLGPLFQQHTAVDDLSGVVLAITITTDEVNDGQALGTQSDAMAAVTGKRS